MWRELCTDACVNVCGLFDFVVFAHRDQKMPVWKAALLELDAPAVRRHSAKHTLVQDFTEELFPFEMEHTRNDVWPIIRVLRGPQILHDFWPVGVGCHGDEVIWLASLPDNGHCV